MKHRWPRLGRMPRLAPLVAVLLAAVGLAMPLTAAAVPILYGGNLYYTGGDVTVDVLSNRTVYEEILQLRSGLSTFDVVSGSKTGSQVTLTAQQLADMGIGVGDELQFGIHVVDTGHTFVLGSGDRNADGVEHAYLRSTPGRGVYAGFEDLYGGGDRDYNDTIYRFSGGASTTQPRVALTQSAVPTSSVTAPSAILLMISGIGLLAYRLRKK